MFFYIKNSELARSPQISDRLFLVCRTEFHENLFATFPDRRTDKQQAIRYLRRSSLFRHFDIKKHIRYMEKVRLVRQSAKLNRSHLT